MDHTVERHPAGGATSGREVGQVTLLVAALLVVAALAMVGITRLGEAARSRARAHTAADAAALAGAAEGRGSAERLARDNGARLLAYHAVGTDVIVTVAVHGARATARARGSAIGRPGR